LADEQEGLTDEQEGLADERKGLTDEQEGLADDRKPSSRMNADRRWPGLAAWLVAGLTVVPLATMAGPFEVGDRNENPWFRSGREAVEAARTRVGTTPRARNVILFLGDGMGLSTITAARILEGQTLGGPGEDHQLSFERFPYVALAKTYNTNQQVPDSAGTMTAILSGVKTKAGTLGVDDQIVYGDVATVAAARVPTLCEEAERAGMSTGLVTTTRLTHATPAACYGHSAQRDWEADTNLSPEASARDFPDLARQFVEFDAGDGIDVTFAGGRAPFLPASQADPEYPDQRGVRADGRDLMSEWQKKAPERRVLWNRAQFDAHPTSPERTSPERGAAQQVLGLFEPSHMRFEIERGDDPAGEPSLSEMTKKALDLLQSRERGYLLIVEGGRIDHGHHANSAHRALTETIEFARAVAVAVEATREADTLIVVTADHGHPFTQSGYARRGNPILGLAEENRPEGPPVRALDGTQRPYAVLSYALGPGHPGKSDAQPAGPKRFPHGSPRKPPVFEPGTRPDLGGVDVGAPDHLQEAMVPRYSGTHSGEDVPVFARGPGAALFQGVLEQHTIYHSLVDAMGRSAEE